MEIKTTEDSGRIILDEKFDLTNAEDVKKKFFVLIEKNIIDIILDFKNVKEIDSAGLGKILLFNKVIRENDGNLVIENVNSDYVNKIFDMLDLRKILKIND